MVQEENIELNFAAELKTKMLCGVLNMLLTVFGGERNGHQKISKMG